LTLRRLTRRGASPLEIEQAWLEEYLSSSAGRGIGSRVVGNGPSVLQRLLIATGRCAWDVERSDLRLALRALADAGVTTPLLIAGLQAFTGFHRFLAATRATEIESRFGLPLADPLGERAVAAALSGSPLRGPIAPRAARIDGFFSFLRDRLASTRQFSPAGRDYVVLRTIYHCGLRTEEACSLRVSDVHLRRGSSGALRVRSLRLSSGSAHARWVPMLDGLDVIIRWYLEDARPPGPDSWRLFADSAGGRLRRGRVRNRLAFLLELEGRGRAESFSPHGLRHAFAVRNYERGLELATIQHLLNHPDLRTTMGYVQASAFTSPSASELGSRGERSEKSCAT